MKKTLLAITVLGAVAMNVPTARAGDHEWATVGKVLTGVAAAGFIAHVIDSHAHVSVSFGAPAVYAPAPVVCAPAPAVVYAPPRVVYAPTPVIYRGPRVVYRDHGYRSRWDHRDGRQDDNHGHGGHGNNHHH